MENPYAAGELTPELAEEERRRPKFWRGLLTAYAIHHVCSVLGILIGLLIKPNEWQKFFPFDSPLKVLGNLTLIPLMDLYIVLEPFFLRLAIPELLTPWHWFRIPLTLTIPLAVFMYAKTRNRDWLLFLAVVSLGVFITLVLWWSVDPRTRGL